MKKLLVYHGRFRGDRRRPRLLQRLVHHVDHYRNGQQQSRSQSDG